jgi:hypothetical protein
MVFQFVECHTFLFVYGKEKRTGKYASSSGLKPVFQAILI